MKTLRLITTFVCNRTCEECCNKQWDKKSIPMLIIPKQYSAYDEIILTGGEPALMQQELLPCLYAIRNTNKNTKIILYTASPHLLTPFILQNIDGITITLHTQRDIYLTELFLSIIDVDTKHNITSMRLNVFKGIEFPLYFYERFQIKKDIEWIKDCPLPSNETLMRLPNAR